MGLAFDDRWIWDFWLVRDGDDHHVFYLQAPTEIGDPDARHWNVSIGHAVSQDLVDWTTLPDALAPGPAGAWDDASTWTGSIIRARRAVVPLYTGTSSVEGGLVQRIGLAESDDLTTWRKHAGPVLEADPRWYETLRTAPGTTRRGATRGSSCTPTTAIPRARHGPRPRRRARRPRASWATPGPRTSATWEVLPPVTEPMGFGQLEVPQLHVAGDRSYLVFCSDIETQGHAVARHEPGHRHLLRGR